MTLIWKKKKKKKKNVLFIHTFFGGIQEQLTFTALRAYSADDKFVFFFFFFFFFFS